jgi:hypothetical protein
MILNKDCISHTVNDMIYDMMMGRGQLYRIVNNAVEYKYRTLIIGKVLIRAEECIYDIQLQLHST